MCNDFGFRSRGVLHENEIKILKFQNKTTNQLLKRISKTKEMQKPCSRKRQYGCIIRIYGYKYPILNRGNDISVYEESQLPLRDLQFLPLQKSFLRNSSGYISEL